MTKAPVNIAVSIRARLLNRARQRKEEFQFVLQRYAAERFLYRLGESPQRSRFVLKGAMLFALWGGSAYRATRDLDFTGFGPNDEATLVAAIREICRMPGPGDGIEFLDDSVHAEPIRDESEYHGFRVKLEARLAGAIIPLQIDVGFGNAIMPRERDETYPVLLDAPAPNIRAYSREAVVAEKFHAMVLLGAVNSRLKDFYDLYVLMNQFPFDGAQLAQAIGATFQRRATAIPGSTPVALSAAFYADETRANLWRNYLQRNGLPGAPAEFGVAGEALNAFLSAPLRALVEEVEFTLGWKAGGPWK